MAQIIKGTTYATNDPVTAVNLNALVDNAQLLVGAVYDQTTGTAASSDYLLSCNQGGTNLKKVTAGSVSQLVDLTPYVKADGTVPMTGQLTLANSSPSVDLAATSKAYVDTKFASVTIIPTGAITAFYGSSAPAGWLECNGQSTTGYAALAALVGANVPDLRGEFIRGWSHSKPGVDPGRNLGSFQDHAAEAHRHSQGEANTQETPNTGYSVIGRTINGVTYGTGNQSGPGGYGANASSVQIPSTSGGTVNVASENRPRNVALMYIIKI